VVLPVVELDAVFVVADGREVPPDVGVDPPEHPALRIASIPRATTHTAALNLRGRRAPDRVVRATTETLHRLLR
jgi:hypothetical protein